MQLKEAISLIQSEEIQHEVPETWADLGCGSGLFTLALASFLFPGSLVYAVDKNLGTLKISGSPNRVLIEPHEADFINDELNLTNLDGILMANALHFVKDKRGFLKGTKNILRDNGRFLIVEYDTDTPNPWVPYPVSFLNLKELFTEQGYSGIKKLHQRKSLYNTGNLYSAIITLSETHIGY